MRTRKNVLLLFSKVPQPGLVKTRLTTLKDGTFAPEVASALYHCMLFDVAEVCCAALAKLEARNLPCIPEEGEAGEAEGAHSIDGNRSAAPASASRNPGEAIRDEYELIISTAPASNLDAMRQLFADSGTWPRPIAFATDEGPSFDAHYNDAFRKAWEAGADVILSMGADMPALTEEDVIRGFEALHQLEEAPRGGIALAPDQELGVSIIGWTRHTDFDHSGVFYNQEGLTVLPAYIAKARRLGLPAIYLPPVPDVDTMADLMHNVTLVEALCYCAESSGNAHPWRTADALAQIGWTDIRIMPNDLRDPREDIDGR